MSLNTILETPTFDQLKGILKLGGRNLTLQLLNKVCPLIMQDPSHGQKIMVTLLPGNFRMSQSISSNVPSSVPLLQHLASSSVIFQHNLTPSDRPTVKIAWEGGTFSIYLEFNGPPHLIDNPFVMVSLQLHLPAFVHWHLVK